MGDAVLVYDDDCGFCTWWAEFFDERSDVGLVGFSTLDPDLRERLPDAYSGCSHLVTDDAVYSCGASLEEAVVRTGVGSAARPVVEFLRGVDAYVAVREWGYRRIAGNRSVWGRLLSKAPPTRDENERADDAE